jgi:hypothetical protein
MTHVCKRLCPSTSLGPLAQSCGYSRQDGERTSLSTGRFTVVAGILLYSFASCPYTAQKRLREHQQTPHCLAVPCNVSCMLAITWCMFVHACEVEFTLTV